MPYSYSRIRASDGLLSSNNNISSSYDTNGNVRVELSPTPRQRNSFTSREPLKLTSSTINRSHTFSKAEKPSHMIRSDTFILKHHSDDYSDEHTMPTIIDYGTYTRSRSKSKSRANNNYSSDEKSRQHSDDKSNYATYTRPPPKDKHYANVDGYRKSSRSQHRDEQRHHRSYRSHSHDSTDRNHHHMSGSNTATLTRRAKPKRVESFIKKFDTINFWKRRDSKDKSPSPATNNNGNNNTTNGSSSVGGDTLKRTKNIFNLIASSKKSTRDIGIECKLDQEERQERYDHFDSSYSHQYGSNGGGGAVVGNDMGLRKSSVQSLNEELPKYRTRAMSKPKVYEHGSTQLLTSIIKTPERRYAAAAVPTTRVGFDVKSRSKYTPSPPIDTYDDTRTRRPVGVASPQPQIRSRSVLKNGNSTLKKQAPLPPSTPPYSSTLKSTRLLASIENGNNLHDNDLTRQENDRMSFREYRERLLKAKNENNRRLLAENSDDELRKSHQQSFFVPI